MHRQGGRLAPNALHTSASASQTQPAAAITCLRLGCLDRSIPRPQLT